MAFRDELIAASVAVAAEAESKRTTEDDAADQETQADMMARIRADFEQRAMREAQAGSRHCEVATVRNQAAASRVVTYLQNQGFTTRIVPHLGRFTVWAGW